MIYLKSDFLQKGDYINEEYKGELMIIPDLELANEQYGIAARKDGAYTAKIISNAIIASIKKIMQKLIKRGYLDKKLYLR